MVAATIAAIASCAGSAAAAQRPGSTIWTQQGFPGNSIRAIDGAPDGRAVVAGMVHPLSTTPYVVWVGAFRPDGTLDPNFGDGGTTTFDDPYRYVVGMVVQPDGRILIAETNPYTDPVGSNLLRRLMPDGRPDPTFGVNGELEPQLPAGNAITSLALQPDGHILLGAGTRNPGPVVVARYLAGGAPDPSFGSGGRTVISPGADSGPALDLQPSGGIVMTARRNNRILVGRLTSTGALDSSFGGGAGLTPVQFARPAWADRLSVNLGASAIVLPTGRIRLAVAFAPRGSQVDRSSLVGLTASGHPDRRFGNHGLALGGPPLRSADDPGPSDGDEAPSSLVVDQRGGVLVVSTMWTSSDDLSAEARTTIRRFRPDGILDRSFGRNGGVRADGTYAAYTAVEDAAALVDDDLLVGEHSWNGKYQSDHSTRLRSLSAGYDDDRPAISVLAGCRYLRVRVRDLSALDAVVVRASGRVVRRTSAKRFRVPLPEAAGRVSVRATDLAGNTSRKRTRLPHC